jgi:hypothetical protein
VESFNAESMAIRLLAELERHSDLEAVREGVADMQAGHSVPIEQAKTADRIVLFERFAQ